MRPLEGTPRLLTYDTRGSSYVLIVEDSWTGLIRRFTRSPVRDGLWWLTAIEDRNGNTVFVERDDDGLPSFVAHSGGCRVEVTTTSDPSRVTGLHVLTEDGPVRVRAFGHDEAGDLTDVRNVVGATLRFDYDASHRVVGWRDSGGTTYTYTYDDSGRVVATHGSDGILDSRLEYSGPDEAGHTSVIYVDSLGNATVHRANPRGQIVSITDPEGRTTLQQWDPNDRLLSRTDPEGRTVRHHYDEAGNLVETEHEDGTRTRAVYDERLHLPTLITVPGGSTVRHAYDARGNLVRVTEPDGATTSFTHDPTGAVATVTDALGHTTTVRSDGAGLPLSVTDPLGVTTVLTRDVFGRVTSLTDALGSVTTLEWSAEGKPVRMSASDGSAETWEWDGEGNCVRHTDARGSTFRFEYAHFSLLRARTGPDGAWYEFTHDTEQPHPGDRPGRLHMVLGLEPSPFPLVDPAVQGPPGDPHRPAVRVDMGHGRQLPYQRATLAPRQRRVRPTP